MVYNYLTFAVYGNGAACPLAYLKEFVEDLLGRITAVHEEQVVVLKSRVREPERKPFSFFLYRKKINQRLARQRKTNFSDKILFQVKILGQSVKNGCHKIVRKGALWEVWGVDDLLVAFKTNYLLLGLDYFQTYSICNQTPGSNGCALNSLNKN